MSLCETCGNEVVEGADFCGTCGTKVEQQQGERRTSEAIVAGAPHVESIAKPAEEITVAVDEPTSKIKPVERRVFIGLSILHVVLYLQLSDSLSFPVEYLAFIVGILGSAYLVSALFATLLLGTLKLIAYFRSSVDSGRLSFLRMFLRTSNVVLGLYIIIGIFHFYNPYP